MTRFYTGVATVVGAILMFGGCDQGKPPPSSTPSERLTNGPIPAGPGYTMWFTVREGEVFSDGFEVLRVKEKIRIDSVSVLGSRDGAPEFLGARLGLPGRPFDFYQRMKGFPPVELPARYQVDAEGADLLPGKSYMLILGFDVTQADEPYVREGIQIDYSAGDEEYRTVFDSRLVTCPRPMTENKCSKLYPAEG